MPSRNVTLVVRAVGARQAARDMTAVARATSAVGGASGRLTRVLSGTALGIGVVTAQAARLGLQFNATMETQRLAFSSFLGSTTKATKYLDRLYELAAKTPFEFKDLVQGSRTLLAYGQNAESAYKTLTLLGDALGAAGGGVEQIQRSTVALGQVQAAGVLHAQDLNQLVAAGVTSVPKLAEAMGMSALKFRKQMQLGKIDSERFFKAQQKVWSTDPIYQGMAAKQAKTYQGMLSTLHDYTIQTLGSMTKGLFRELKNDVLPDMIELTSLLGQLWANKKLTLADKIDLSRGAIGEYLTPYVDRIVAWWNREDVGSKIAEAIQTTMRNALITAGQNLLPAVGKFAQAFGKAFWKADWMGKAGLAVGGTMLLRKLGILGALGGLSGKLGKKGGMGGGAMGSPVPVWVVNMGPGMGGAPGKAGGKGGLWSKITGGAGALAGRLGLRGAAGAAGGAAATAGLLQYGGNWLGEKLGINKGLRGAQSLGIGKSAGQTARDLGLGRHARNTFPYSAPRKSTFTRRQDRAYEEYKGLPSWLTSGGKPPDIHTTVNIDGKKVATAVHRAATKKASTR